MRERRKSREVEIEKGNLLSVFGEKNVYFVESYILVIQSVFNMTRFRLSE